MRSLPLIFLLVGAACITHLAHLQILQEQPPAEAPFAKKRFISNPDMLKAFSLGFDRMLADLWWLAFVQYYGDPDSVIKDRLKYGPDYMRLVVALDPQFIRPYWFASFLLAGDLKRVKEASDLLDLGIKNNPDEWSLPYIAGFNQALYCHDYKRAAKYYRMASKIKNAPTWLNDQAEIMESDVPSKTREIKTWERMYKEGDSLVKAKALDNLQVLLSEVYWEAPNEQYRERARNKLNQYELKLLPRAAQP